MSTLSKILITIGLCDSSRNLKFGANRVAAGDPTKGVRISNSKGSEPERIRCENEIVETVNYTKFDVDGSSMSPGGVSDGDKLLCETLSPNQPIPDGTFAIVKVDEGYYQWKKRDVRYKHKLRRVLMEIPYKESVEGVIQQLKNQSEDALKNSIRIQENEENLRKKYDDVHNYYDDKTIDGKAIDRLILSVTYREGELRYSFHPACLVEYKAVYTLKIKNGDWEIIKL